MAAALVVGWGVTVAAQLPKGVVVEKVEAIERLQAEIAEKGGPTPYLSVNIHGHTAPLRAMAFGPRSQQLFTTGKDKVVHVWDLPGAAPKAFAVEPVGPWRPRTIRWEIARGLRGTINALAPSPDGRTIAIAGYGARGGIGEVVWADTTDGAFTHGDHAAHRDPVTAIAYSPNGRTMMTSDLRGRIVLWRMDGGRPKAEQIHFENRVTLIRPLAMVGNSHAVFPRFAGNVLARKPDGSKVPVATYGVQMYDVNADRMADLGTVHYEYVTALAASGNGRWIASADGARSLYLFHIDQGGAKRFTLVKGHVVVGLSFSSDGRYLAVGTMGEAGREPPQIQIWDTTTKKKSYAVRMHREVAALAISDDGKWLAAGGGENHNVYLWKLDRGKPMAQPRILAGGHRITRVQTAAKPGDFRTRIETSRGEAHWFDPAAVDEDPLVDDRLQGRAMVVAPARMRWTADVSRDRTRIQLRQGGAARGVIRLNPVWHGQIANADAHAFIPDENGDPHAIAVGTDVQNGIFIFNLAVEGECELLRYFRGHYDQVNTLSVTPDRRYLVSGSADGTVRYWKLAGLRGGDLVRRWGAELALEDGRTLKVNRCVDTGPLFHKNVRDGDVIEKILWATTGADGRRQTYSSSDPRRMQGTLASLPWHSQVTFVTRRGERQLPAFNLVAGWRHLLAVYVHNEEWIAWHPSGYYACSPGGSRMIGWQINRSQGETPRHFPAVRFHKSLYKPAELSHLLRAGGLVKPDMQSHSAPPSPPVVQLLAPQGRRVKQGQNTLVIKARAKAQGSRPVVSMQPLINGVPAAQLTKAIEVVTVDPEREAPWIERQWTIKLQPGEHTIAVRASTVDSHAYSESVSVEFAPAKAKRTLHLLAIGVAKYAQPKLNLKYPVVDAERMIDVFKSRGVGLFDEIRVVPLYNEAADKRGIQAAFKQIAARATMNDLVVVFYSGHGHRVDETFYLVSHDAHLGNIRERGVADDDIKRLCRDVASHGAKMIIMIDACRSGAMRLERLTAELATDDFRVAMMASSKGDQLSWEHEAFGGGAFTQALYLGLHEGEADQTMVADRRVDNDELGVYVRRKVRNLVSEIAGEIKQKYPKLFEDREVIQTPVNNFQALDPFALTLLPDK